MLLCFSSQVRQLAITNRTAVGDYYTELDPFKLFIYENTKKWSMI